MVRGPMRCLCCGAEMSTTDVIGFRCGCDEMGIRSCLDCGKCAKHCDCRGGLTTDWAEVQRRADALRAVAEGRGEAK